MKLRRLARQLLYVGIIYTDEHVLRLNVGMDDLTFGVQIVKTLQHLSSDCSYVLQRDATIVGLKNELQQTVSKHLEHHANVSAIDARYCEVIQQLNRLVSFGVAWITITNRAQNLDLILGGVSEARCRLDHFQRHITLDFQFSAQPDSGKVSPA